MYQPVFAIIFVSVISTYFGALILMYVVRTLLTSVSGESTSNQRVMPSISSEFQVEVSARVAIPANLLAD